MPANTSNMPSPAEVRGMRGVTVGLTRPLVRADMAVPMRASWAMRSAASCSRRPRLYSPPNSPIVRSPCNTRSGFSRTSWPILPPMPASRSNRPGPASSGSSTASAIVGAVTATASSSSSSSSSAFTGRLIGPGKSGSSSSASTSSNV